MQHEINSCTLFGEEYAPAVGLIGVAKEVDGHRTITQ
jgi:hypothetical protein